LKRAKREEGRDTDASQPSTKRIKTEEGVQEGVGA